ncbi:MAG: hypothetical protein DMF90_23955 [Acidobacteria bacterium]|nr:MAG: hypothetical protein DMF90_23955 [Acidobacteriota bacterium]
MCFCAWRLGRFPGPGTCGRGSAARGSCFSWRCPSSGRLFPFDLSEPLVGLAALADVGIGIPYFVASGLGLGGGDVRAVSYEYGNAFAIVAGLLNVLVIIDAYDVALGRK